MYIVWCVLLAMFLVIEIITPQLTTIWFALGSLVALIVSMFDIHIAWQIGAFIVVSCAAIACTRKFAKKFLDTKKQPTNYDRYLAQEAIVIERIDDITGSGQVNVKGAVWSAKSLDGTPIAKGTLVTVVRIEGVKVIVKPKNI